LLQTHSSGMGSASGMPWQRVCIHTPHTSHATMRSPSSTRVPHLQLTTQSSKPPAKQQISLSSCSGSSDSCTDKKKCLGRPAFVCQNRHIMQQNYCMQLEHCAGSALCMPRFCSKSCLACKIILPYSAYGCTAAKACKGRPACLNPEHRP